MALQHCIVAGFVSLLLHIIKVAIDGLSIPSRLHNPSPEQVRATALPLLLFDVLKQTWHELTHGESSGYANWSSDSRFVYVSQR